MNPPENPGRFNPRAELVLVRNGRSCGGVYWTGFLGHATEWLELQLRG